MGSSKKNASRPFNFNCTTDSLRGIAQRFMDFSQGYTRFFDVGCRNVAHSAKAYLAGLMMDAPRKNMERMEEYVSGLNYEGVQNFLSNSPWNHEALTDQIGRDVNELLGSDNSVLMIDESCHEKKGTKSVGVARQYNGRLGKIDNCQVGVYTALFLDDRVSLLNHRLYLPEEWTRDEKRCEAAKIPQDKRAFKTKGRLAMDMVDDAVAQEISFGWVAADSGYGDLPWFIRELTQRKLKAVLAVRKDFTVYWSDPQPYLPRRTGKVGRKYSRPKPRCEPTSAQQLLCELGSRPWSKVSVRDTTKGRLYVKAKRQRIWLWDGEEDYAREAWIIFIDNPHNGGISYHISNAENTSTLKEIAVVACQRYFIERSFQDAKTSVGMSDYQARSWLSWNHHMCMVQLGLLFMLKERIANSKDVSLLTCEDIVDLLNIYLPRADLSEEAILHQLKRRHKKRAKSIESAYRRQRYASDCEGVPK